MDEPRQAENRTTVLLLDDEPMVLEALTVSLRRYPFSILTATSGAEALRLLESKPVEVVISDERMPNMTGAEFLSIVRQKYPQTIRIVLTGQASLDAAIRAINEGEVYRFLTKPCSAADLAVTIQHAIQFRNLARQSVRLLARTRAQDKVLQALEDAHPGISDVTRDTHGAIVVDENIEVEELIRQMQLETR